MRPSDSLALVIPAAVTERDIGSVSFDALVSGGEQHQWYGEAECFGGFEVDHQIEPLRPLYLGSHWAWRSA